MKKYILILAAINLCFPLILSGQDQIAFRFGLTRANISGNDVKDGYEWKTGLALGASFIYEMKPAFSLELELMYQENGYSTEYSDLHLNYYNIACLFKRNSEGLIKMPIKKMSVFAIAGPNLAVMINSVYEFESRNNMFGSREFVDFGLIFGSGLDYRFDFGNITFEVRYNFGFVNHYKNSSNRYTNIDQKNRTWLFLLGYSVNMKDMP